MFPEIETERLRLREIKPEDAAVLFAYFSKEITIRYYGQEPFQQVEDAEMLIEAFRKTYEEKKGIRWGIECRETNELIGTIGYHLWSPRHKRAEIGYDLHPDHWGKGYATEAVKAVIHYGFQEMELNRIGAVVFLENEASHKLLRKLGFEKEGILKEYMYQNGLAQDTILYSLLKET